VEGLRIQWGTSLCMPPSSMGAHVSAVPNHQVGRIAPLATRAAVAFFGAFGYELDPTVLRPAEREEIAGQVALYKQWRDVLQFGRFIRLWSPFDGDGNEVAWMSVAADSRRAVVGHYTVLSRPSPGPARLRLRGLDPDVAYRVSTWPARAEAGAVTRGGDELMRAGLLLDRDRAEAERGDFRARLWLLEA
jgi:alpha-galactosidase